MSTPWRVPLMWPGRTVAVLASGPSMSSAVADAVRAAGVPAVVTNRTFELAPWADILVGNDARWWMCNHDALTFRGIKVCAQEACCPFRDVKSLRNAGKDGFDPDPECVRTGGNGGYTALHIVGHTGAARALLCGFDMHGGHWHEPHPDRNPTRESFGRWIPRFKALGDALAARGVEVLNCTPGSALPWFPFVALEDALEACAEPAA